MQTLLFPTDFSETAANALAFVVPVAKKSGARVCILHTSYLPPQPGEAPMLNAVVRHEEAKAKLDEYLIQVQAEFADSGVEFESVLCSGPLIDEVNLAVENRGINLIIMGTQGATGLEEIFLGSNANDLLRYADVPVLVVPESADFTPFTDLAYFSDLTHPAEEAFLLSRLIEFAKLFQAKVHMVHVRTEGEKMSLEDLDKLAEKYPQQFGYENFHFSLEVAETPIDGINSYIAEHKVQLIALQRQRRGFFESIFHRSVTKKVVCEGKVPVLAFHG